MIVLFGPLCFRSRRDGIHEVHYAMVTVLAMGIGLFAPPFGVGFTLLVRLGVLIPIWGFDRSWRICWRCWSACSWWLRFPGFQLGSCERA